MQAAGLRLWQSRSCSWGAVSLLGGLSFFRGASFHSTENIFLCRFASLGDKYRILMEPCMVAHDVA